MLATLQIARMELRLLIQPAWSLLASTLFVGGLIALLQDPPFARRLELDLAWGSIEALALVLIAGLLPWLWLATRRKASDVSELRSVAPPAAVVVGTWLGQSAVALLSLASALALLITVDRMLGHGAAGPRVGALALRVLAVGLPLLAWAQLLRWLVGGLLLRAALWITILTGSVGLFGLGWPVAADRLQAASSIAEWLLPTSLTTVAGLFGASALLLRRRSSPT